MLEFNGPHEFVDCIYAPFIGVTPPAQYLDLTDSRWAHMQHGRKPTPFISDLETFPEGVMMVRRTQNVRSYSHQTRRGIPSGTRRRVFFSVA